MRLQLQEMTSVEQLVTDDDQMREWLPKLVGSREEATAAVHDPHVEGYPEPVESFASGPVRIEIEHPDDLEAIELAEATHAELLGDLRG